MRLRDEQFYARSLHLGLAFLQSGRGVEYWDKRVKFFETQDTAILLKELTTLWNEVPIGSKIFKVGVVLSGLVPSDKHQLSLWEDVKQTKLMRALDKLNKTHRKNLVVYGASSSLDSTPHAPIAFGHIPDEFE